MASFKFSVYLCSLVTLIIPNILFAEEKKEQALLTTRVPQLETDEVQVWKTIIFPKQPLKMHRNDNKRIVIALTDTELKVVNDKGESHLLKWTKGSAHLLEADRQGELHADLNESDHPMEVMVIQFKNKDTKK